MCKGNYRITYIPEGASRASVVYVETNHAVRRYEEFLFKLYVHCRFRVYDYSCECLLVDKEW